MTTSTSPTGYSKRPLGQKLGIKRNFRVAILNASEEYPEQLAPLPEDVVWFTVLDIDLDFIQYFTDSRDELAEQFPALKAAMHKEAMLWISWPKQASKVPTDLNENIVREIGLANGLVDVKVAAVDHIWSGLKFVYRKRDR